MSEAAPRAGLGLALCVGVVLSGTGAVRAQGLECPARAEVTETDGGLLHVVFSVPCQPYAPVDLTYGPLRIGEETSLDGSLALNLPRLGKADNVAFQIGSTRLSAPLPPARGQGAAFVAVRWPDGNPWGTLQADGAVATRLGFPGRRDLAPLDVLTLSDTPSASLIVPVAADSCGTIVTAEVVSTDFSQARPLSVSLPPCDLAAARVTIPLR